MGRGLPPYQVALIHPAVWSQQTWAENWGCAALPPLPPFFGGGELGPHLAQYGLFQGLPPYTKCHLDPSRRLATTDMGRKVGAVVPLFVEGELGSHLTQCRLGRGLYLPTKWHLDPSSRLARTDTNRKLEERAVRAFGEDELGPHLTQCSQGRGYLRVKFHLDPCNRLATIHQRYRQTGWV